MADYSNMRTVCLLLLMAIVFVSSARAQDTGVVQGRVIDRQTGHALAGAIVQAWSPSGLFTTKSDRNGFFVFMSLPTGVTRISATHEGYAPNSVAGVCVDPDQIRFVMIAVYDEILSIPIPSIYPQWRCYFGD